MHGQLTNSAKFYTFQMNSLQLSFHCQILKTDLHPIMASENNQEGLSGIAHLQRNCH